MPLGTGSKKDVPSMGCSFAIAKCKSNKRSDAYAVMYSKTSLSRPSITRKPAYPGTFLICRGQVGIRRFCRLGEKMPAVKEHQYTTRQITLFAELCGAVSRQKIKFLPSYVVSNSAKLQDLPSYA